MLFQPRPHAPVVALHRASQLRLWSGQVLFHRSPALRTKLKASQYSTVAHAISPRRNATYPRPVSGPACLDSCPPSVVHQSPRTAKGFHFLTLDDEWGMINVIVSPGVVVRYGQHLHSTQVFLVEGSVQREGDVINLIAQ
jgi:hypothetical protein